MGCKLRCGYYALNRLSTASKSIGAELHSMPWFRSALIRKLPSILTFHLFVVVLNLSLPDGVPFLVVEKSGRRGLSSW